VTDLISVIVTTYNREDALDLALRALSRQADRNFEVLVADDGSGPATAGVIAGWKDNLGVPLTHVWQENHGFRAGEIRNRAIAASRGSYVVFLDGDCLARPDFVAQHRALAEPGWFVVGNRILLSPPFTNEVLLHSLAPETWSIAKLLGARLGGGVNRLMPALNLPLGGLRRAAPKSWVGARTCNLAVARADLDRVDGFDTMFNGWGLEDSDLVVRLIKAGTRRKDGRFATGVVHLWHAEADRSGLMRNQRMLDDVLRNDRTRAQSGLSQLAEPARGKEAAL
jgi:glycosyltransferase involved in cell wall biosynthesis